MHKSEECTPIKKLKLCGNKAGQLWSYIWRKKGGVGVGEEKSHHYHPSPQKKKTLLGGLNEITPQKIELAGPTEGRNARN